MRHSLETAAQVTTVIEVDMTGVVNLRKKWKPVYAERHGVNLTYVPFVARATMDAIGRWPWVNSEVRGETALIKRYVNLGMAVAIDDSKGLMVPVIHHAEELNLVGLSRAVIDLAEKARTKTLTPDEMSGGTFTITNPGVFGALIGTPIIPEGQVAILDVEAIVKRPVVVTDRHGNDAIAIRHMMFLCLSYDHRLVDGAYAAQFMAQVKQNLEGWGEDAIRPVTARHWRTLAHTSMSSGVVPYGEALAIMQELAAARNQQAIPDTVMLLRARAGDHARVARRRGRRSCRSPTRSTRAAASTSSRSAAAGARPTTAPGQLVCYPILDLGARGRDLRRYVRALEQTVVATLADFGVEGRTLDEAHAERGLGRRSEDRVDRRPLRALGDEPRARL